MEKKVLRKRKGQWGAVSLSLSALIAISGSHSTVIAQDVLTTHSASW